MAAGSWHYIDSAGAQVGPMDTQAVVDAVRAGVLTPASLLWREGMASWRPLRELEAELGLAPAAAVAPSAPGGGNPYDPMPHAGLASVPGSTDVVDAGFVRRWAALVLDQLILSVPLVLVMFGLGFAGALRGEVDGDQAMGLAVLAIYALWFLCAGLYYSLLESSPWQATLGKRALGIKVVDTDGHRISLGRALGRWVSASLSYMTFYIGFLMAAFTERKRALHDYVAGTLVVDAWAYTDHPERQKRGLSGCLIVFLIAMMIVPIVAILAAIAISQYQDYVVRSQVFEGSALADGIKVAMAEYVDAHGEMPAGNEAAGLPTAGMISGAYVASVDIGRRPGRIDVTYSSRAPHRAHSVLDGRHLYFEGETAGGGLRWSCGSDELPQKFCPSSCACTGSSASR